MKVELKSEPVKLEEIVEEVRHRVRQRYIGHIDNVELLVVLEVLVDVLNEKFQRRPGPGSRFVVEYDEE